MRIQLENIRRTHLGLTRLTPLPYFGGSTATVCVVTTNNVIVANLGDSPALMFTREGALIYSTVDHDCSDLSEAARMNTVGNGCVYDRYLGANANERARILDSHCTNDLDAPQSLIRVESGLAPTRAFGDPQHSGVFAVPNIYDWPRQAFAYLCVCSDSFVEGIMPSGRIGPTRSRTDIVNELLRSIEKDVILEVATQQAVSRRVASLNPYTAERTHKIDPNQ